MNLRRWQSRVMILAICLSVVPLSCVRSEGQDSLDTSSHSPLIEGYITTVQLPGEFAINDFRVLLRPDSKVQRMVTRSLAEGDSRDLAEMLHPGVFVWVFGQEGDYSFRKRTVTGRIILVRNEQTRKLEGAGLVFKVIEDGPEPIYIVDGYRIRPEKSTAVSFYGGLKQLSDVGPGTLVDYAGSMAPDGTVVLTMAKFVHVEDWPRKAEFSGHVVAPDFAAHSDGGIYKEIQKVGAAQNEREAWFNIPADQALQGRVARIGMSLVPAYQREMTDNDPAKIHFQFYAIDDKGKLRNGYAVPFSGLIVISKQAAQRIENDSQLATVLAQGIAEVLQLQRATSTSEKLTKDMGIGIAAAGTGTLFS